MNEDLEQHAVRKSRRILIFVFLLFVLPVIGAWLLYANLDQWRPANTGNHGQLINPARPLPDIYFANLHGTGQDKHLREKWTLLYIAGSDCGEVCQRNLYKMRQVRLAQGKNIHRVTRVMVLTQPELFTELSELLTGHPGLNVVQVDPAVPGEWLRQFDLPGADGNIPHAERIYLVDPLGNLMMWYAPDTDAGGMIRDLQHLMKLSRIG